MKVELVHPQGYCAGVRNAIEIAFKAKRENPTRNVYVLGMLVHNDLVIKELEENGINTLEGTDEIQLINSLKRGDVLIFSAHGHDEKLHNLAVSKGLIIYDATCPKVANNLKIIKDEISAKHQVIYVGQNGHRETNAALSVSDKVSLYDTKLLINYQLITDTSPLVINQTTLNFLTLKDIHNDIKEHIPGARIADEICSATRKRQEAILNIDKDVNLILIVGDQKSSNSKKLYELAKSHYQDSDVYLVSNLEDVKKLKIKGEKAVISSGASTPLSIVERIYEYLLTI